MKKVIAGLALILLPASLWAESAVIQAEGELTVVRAGKPSSVEIIPFPLEMGDEVRTDARGSAHIRFGDASEVRLGPDSVFFMKEEAASRTSLFLSLGKLWASVTKNKARLFEVTTPVAVASVRGTQFTVLSNKDSSQLIVHEGLVHWSNGAQGFDVSAGFKSEATGKSVLAPQKAPELSPMKGTSQAKAPPASGAPVKDAKVMTALAGNLPAALKTLGGSANLASGADTQNGILYSKNFALDTTTTLNLSKVNPDLSPMNAAPKMGGAPGASAGGAAESAAANAAGMAASNTVSLAASNAASLAASNAASQAASNAASQAASNAASQAASNAASQAASDAAAATVTNITVLPTVCATTGLPGPC